MSVPMDEKPNIPIQGPLTVALHDDGVDHYLQKGQNVTKVSVFGGGQNFGFVMPDAEAKPLQRMAVVGFIQRIDYKVKNIASERANLVDLTKLMSYGMLYRQFDARVWDLLISSELTSLWNRQYPKFQVKFGADTRRLGIQKVLDANQATITTYKQALLKSVQEYVSKKAKLLDDEKRKQMFLAIRFIQMVDPFVWLLLTVFRSTPGSHALLKEIQRLLISYLSKSDSPEYLALMLIELEIIVGDISSMGVDGEDKIDHDPIFTSFEFSARKREQGERTRMKITLSKEQSDFESLRDAVEDKKFLDLKGKSLDSFFDGDSRRTLSNREIGMYYLSYLKEACKRMNISFESFVNVNPGSNHTTMNLVLTF